MSYTYFAKSLGLIRVGTDEVEGYKMCRVQCWLGPDLNDSVWRVGVEPGVGADETLSCWYLTNTTARTHMRDSLN